MAIIWEPELAAEHGNKKNGGLFFKEMSIKLCGSQVIF